MRRRDLLKGGAAAAAFPPIASRLTGASGTVNVPIRLAVVQEGVNPKTIVSKFASVQVTVASAVDRVAFTHIDPEISFPMPQPAANIDSYVIYVGFDPAGAQQEKKKPAAKPKPRSKAGT